ncbi:MAG: TolC family protein [Bacteroidota bacterium]
MSACPSRSLVLSVPRLRLYVVATLTLLASGCSAPEIIPPAALPATVTVLPPSFAEAESTAVYDPLRWWTAFEDPALDALIDSTLVGNLDLVEAVARVEEARARAVIARAPLLPTVSGSADRQQQSQPANAGQFGAFGGGQGAGGQMPGSGQMPDSTGGGMEAPDRIEFTTYSAGVSVSYEFDFWGRARNETRAAVGDLYAATADLQTARLGALASTIGTYFEIVDLRARIVLTVETLDVLTDRVEVTQDRYLRGLVTSFELYQILGDYRSTQAGLPLLERQLADAEGRLAVLVGRYPSEIPALLPDTLRPRLTFAPVPPGLPAELLVQRPDIRAAAYRFEAARYRIGAARAALFPSLSLTGSVGLTGNTFVEMLDPGQWTASFIAGLTAPIFQGGQIRANIDLQEAGYRRLGTAYARNVLTAVREVESALEAAEEERQRYRFLLDQLAEARSTVALQAERVERGLGDVVGYLDALRNELAVRTQIAQAGRSVALARLDIHRALGGGWTEGGVAPRIALVAADVPTPLDLVDPPAVPVVGVPDIPDPVGDPTDDLDPVPAGEPVQRTEPSDVR